MILIILSVALMIFSIVFIYEKKLSSVEKLNKGLISINSQLVIGGDRLMFNYRVLIRMLQQHLTEEELDELFNKTRSEMIVEIDKELEKES